VKNSTREKMFNSLVYHIPDQQGCVRSEKSSVRNGNLTSQSGEGEQEVNNADLLSEYQSLYQQIGKTREKLAPLGSILWHVPNSGFEEVEQVNLAEYQHRLKARKANLG
jgi:hypothetical protein